MPFVKHSRDKRGYEHLYLVQPNPRRGKTAPVLYWYRTPPNIRVGRGAFDDFARRALERMHPDLAFDWKALTNTPVPPPAPDVEKWRDRRRQEKAARQAARAEAEAEAAMSTTRAGEPEDVEAEESGGEVADDDTAGEQSLASEGAETAAESVAGPAGEPVRAGRRRRRWRGRGPR